MILRIAMTLGIFICCLIIGGSFLLKKINQQQGPLDHSHHSVINKFYYRLLGDIPPETTSPLPLQKNPFSVELANFLKASEAQSYLEHLTSLGVKAYYTPFSDEGLVIYRVRTGIFATQEEAETAAEKLAKNFDLTPKVIALY